MSWVSVCGLGDVLPGTGACALIGVRQVALFHFEGRVFALDNFDPAGGANVLSRGLLGDLQGEQVVASPLYKHHFSLSSGRCLEDGSKSVNTYPVRLENGCIWLDAGAVPERTANGLRTSAA